MTLKKISRKLVIATIFITGAVLVNTLSTTGFHAAWDIELNVFSLEKTIIILSSIMLGPWWGAFIAAGEHIISSVIQSGATENIFVPLTVISTLGGFIPGILYRFFADKLHRLLNIFIATVVTQLIFSALAIPFLLTWYYNTDLELMLADRLIAQAIVIPIIVLVLYMILHYFDKIQAIFGNTYTMRALQGISQILLLHSKHQAAEGINSFQTILKFNSINDYAEQINSNPDVITAETTLSNVLSTSIDGLWSFSYPDMSLIYINPSAEKIYGRSAQEFLNNPYLWQSLVHPDDQHILQDSINQLIEKGTATRECRVVRADGAITWVREILKLINDESANTLTICGVTTDITDCRTLEELLFYSRFHDNLTGLYNRSHFSENEKDIQRLPAISVIMTDINGLKLINDTYGRETGDLLLKEYAKILRQSFEKNDLIYRWGGDEFLIITKNAVESKSWKLCNRLIKKCENTRFKNIPLSISIGVTSKQHNEGISKTLNRAEDLMYRNKLNESKSSKSLIMKTLIQTLSEKSYETHEHIERMISVGNVFAKKLQLCPNEITRLNTLIILHDVGKINIDSRILLKDTKLSDTEWKDIMKHPEIGYRITHATEEFAFIAEDILAHHEHWDGMGYPRGLKQGDIPYLSRILSLIDSFDVMYNGRPYKQKMPLDAIVQEIISCSGKQFDPRLAEEFVTCLREDSFGFRYTNNNGNKPQRLLFL